MLRKDTLYMLKNDWEPTIPSVRSMKEQVSKAQGSIAGSVRFSNGKITTGKKNK